MSTQGTTIIDFGANGATDASIAVTGQAAFVAGTNLAEAWVNPVASANNTSDNHWVEEFAPALCSDQITGTGFTARLRARRGVAFGKYNIAWVWN